MLQSVSSVFVVYRRKTLTGSPDPTHANGTNKPCKIKCPQKSLSVFVSHLHPDIIQYVLFTLSTSTFFQWLNYVNRVGWYVNLTIFVWMWIGENHCNSFSQRNKKTVCLLAQLLLSFQIPHSLSMTKKNLHSWITSVLWNESVTSCRFKIQYQAGVAPKYDYATHDL